ncbi:hypothetical protein D3C73_617230 [compost metagenome]
MAQDFGFLLETLSRFTAIEETRQSRRAVEAFAGAFQAFEVVEQGDGVFQAGRVVEVEQRLAIHRQPRTFDMPRGAGAVGHFAEADIAGQGAQE